MIDEWSGFADLLATLIEKYISDLDLDSLPDPARPDKESTDTDSETRIHKIDVEKALVA